MASEGCVFRVRPQVAFVQDENAENFADAFFFFSSRRRHTRSLRDWSSDVCSSDLPYRYVTVVGHLDYISHDGLLLPTCAKGATLASVVCRAGGNVERGHRAAAGACDGDSGV